jgi:hypothetical protein
MKRSGSKSQPSAPGVLDGSCMDCGVDTMARGEYYSLKDSVWRAINPLVIGHLCLACAEDRLGRDLHGGDFSSAPINQSSGGRCAALAERLERSPSSAPRSDPPRNVNRECELTEGIQHRLALKKLPQSELGRMSAALLPHRDRSGHVPSATLMRVLSQADLVSSRTKRVQK